MDEKVYLNNQGPDLFAMKTALSLFEGVTLPYLLSKKK
jgi:hypothetical protein